MHKVLLIGKGVQGYKGALAKKGYAVAGFDSMGKAKGKLKEADILIVDGPGKNARGKGLKSPDPVPQIAVTHGAPSGKRPEWWLKEPFAYHIENPSDRALLQLTARIIAERTIYSTEAAFKDDLERAKNEVSFYEEINRMLTSAVGINDILVRIMKQVKDVTKAEAWSILMVDEETGDLVFEKTAGRVGKKIRMFRLKPGEGIAGWVAKEKKPVLIPDVSKDKRFSHKIDRKTYFHTKSLMCVPLVSKDKLLAVLEVINKTTGGPFTKEDLAYLMKLVSQATLALERASLYQKMEELVITDDLTKLFNTRYLHRTIEAEVMRSNRYHTSLSLIFMDVDYFKHINDTYGHLVGSKFLVELGQILIRQLRSIDIVARYGGDEFVIVMPQTSPRDAVRIAERIRKAIEQNVFMKKDGYNLKVTSSFGVAAYPESAKTKEDLLRVADEAMYRVKHTTRNGVFAIT